MNDSVLTTFPSFTQQFEGRIPFMYVDVKRLVTTAVGNLIDPLSTALDYHRRVAPFVLRSDVSTAASDHDVAADWDTVKADPTLPKRGGAHASRTRS